MTPDLVLETPIRFHFFLGGSEFLPVSLPSILNAFFRMEVRNRFDTSKQKFFSLWLTRAVPNKTIQFAMIWGYLHPGTTSLEE